MLSFYRTEAAGISPRTSTRGTINPSSVYWRRRAPGTANADLAKLDLQALERETGFDVEMTRPWWRRLVRR